MIERSGLRPVHENIKKGITRFSEGISKNYSDVGGKRMGHVQTFTARVNVYIAHPDTIFTNEMETILNHATRLYLDVYSEEAITKEQVQEHAERVAILINQHAQAQL